MTSRFTSIVIDANDVEKIAAFWAAVLGREVEIDGDGDVVLAAPDDESVDVLVLAAPQAKGAKNRLHIDLNPVGTDQSAELGRILDLGAVEVDIGQGEPSWVVLADPEGNEFCLLSRRFDETGAGSSGS
ncbi:MAG: VOC family protein [Acidimicrobiales bacterium]